MLASIRSVRRQDCFIRSQTYQPKLPKITQNCKIEMLISENTSTSLLLDKGDDMMEVIEEESKDKDKSKETAKLKKKAIIGEKEKKGAKGGKEKKGEEKKGEKEKKEKVVVKPFCPSKLHCRNIPTGTFVEKWFDVLIDIRDPDAGNVKEWFKGWCVVYVSACTLVCLWE